MTTPGAGTGRLDSYPELNFFGATKVYGSYWQKISPTYKGNNGAGDNKNVMLKTQATYYGMPNAAAHVPGFQNDPSNPDSRIRPRALLINFSDHDGRHLAERERHKLFTVRLRAPSPNGRWGDLLRRRLAMATVPIGKRWRKAWPCCATQFLYR